MNFENLTVVFFDDLFVALIVFVVRVHELAGTAAGKVVRGHLGFVEVGQDGRVWR